MTYLGSFISDDGQAARELTQRLSAVQEFVQIVATLNSESTLGRRRKLEILNATVFSKLLYALPALWLNVAARRKLNGFQNRCLRAAWGIKPAFYSRVSNAKVLELTAQPALTSLLEKRQLLLFGRIARQDGKNPMREATLTPGSLQPAVDRFMKKVGRPRNSWASEVGKLALKVSGGWQRLEETIL